ncbi:MAG: 6-carboxytetrahydropterin synthase QueD [Bacteroidales bacterium]|jgi:6-pyruvoyltetrahydropterin/6-carboxytetrahydropterin synthase|nr:6-carboxytetrahydropterin synthase QueD [Bacteroidales bacterium]
MEKLRLTRKFEFEAAHLLNNYDGLCKNLHGHSYKLFITVIGEIEININSPKLGMVIDFKDLKEIVKENILDKFDHSLIVSRKNKLPEEIINTNKIIFTDFQPTAENLVIFFVNILKEKLPINIKLCNVKLFETENSSAEWNASDN